MIYYPIQTLVKAGITEILIIVSEPHAGDFINVLRNGEDFGLNKVEFAFQDEKIFGIAGAISCGEGFTDDDNIVVILGDNTTDANIKEDVENFKRGAKIFLKEVDNPKGFGVPVFNKKNDIKKIEEKPKNPKSKYAVTGLYIYDNTVFKRIKSLKPSKRGELEITDLNNSYIKDGSLHWVKLKGFWNDAGSFESLFKSNQYWSLRN